MARQRFVKPEFFQHEGLYQAEVASGFPLRIAFEGLWCQADRRGCFEWKPATLKANVLPFDPVDFAEVLTALERANFITFYEVAGRRYGFIPTLEAHQSFHVNEKPNDLIPPPPRHLRLRKRTKRKTTTAPPKHRAGTVQAPSQHSTSTPVTVAVAVTASTTGSTKNSSSAREGWSDLDKSVIDAEPVQRLLDRFPETRRPGYEARIRNWLRGEGLPNGVRPTAEAIVTAIDEYDGGDSPDLLLRFVCRKAKTLQEHGTDTKPRSALEIVREQHARKAVS